MCTGCSSLRNRRRTLCRRLLEQGPDRKFEHALAFAWIRIKMYAIGRTERAEGRNPAGFDSRSRPQFEIHRFGVVKPLSIIEKQHPVEFRLRTDRENKI